MRLLLAEDEINMSKAVAAILKHNNYSVDQVYDGNDAFDYAMTNGYDGIILDVMMPGMDGFQVLEKLRKNNIHTPIIMLSAKGELEDRVQGLDLGADDYLPKPFDSKELIARIRSITRRRSEFKPNILEVGNLKLNKETSELMCDENVIHLTNKEFQMLEMLMLNPNILIGSEVFLEKIWGLDTESEINVVWTYISTLRKRLAQIGSDYMIKATRGAGYSLVKNSEN